MAEETDVDKAKKSLAHLRERKGRSTQAQIAEDTGLTQSYVCKLLNGEFVRLSRGVRTLLEYSKDERAGAVEAQSLRAQALHKEVDRLIARDPEAGRLLLDLIKRIAPAKR